MEPDTSHQRGEFLRKAADHLLLIGVLAKLGTAMSLESKPKPDEQEPPESNGQASEKGGPQGDLKKPYQPKDNKSRN